MHPNDLVNPVADDILASATEAEQARYLPRHLVDRLASSGLFSIYTPRQFGGLDLPLPTVLRVVEEVSRYDGSTGWTVALGFANGLFSLALSESKAAQLFTNGSAVIAGAPSFTARAEPVEGGYRISGRWQFCSGVTIADWMALGAPVVEAGQPRIGPSGPEMALVFLRPSQVEVLDTWHVTGLRATASHDVEVHDVFVSSEMSGALSMPAGPTTLRPSPLANIPFVSLLGIAQSPAVCLGVARHAIEEFRSLALNKERPMSPKLSDQVQAQVGLARAEALLRSARSYWFEAVDCLWEKSLNGSPISLEQRTNTRLASLTTAENSVEAVDLVWRLAGATAVFESCVLERCMRDVRTAAQHLQVQDGRWETAGRVLFGLEPNNPFL